MNNLHIFQGGEELPIDVLLLTIAVPFYNTAKFLPRCIESLVSQDLPANAYEILLVNDGSTDNSLAVAEHYATQYSNIRILSHTNKGIATTRNICFANARGKYFRFVDSDDYIPQNNLKGYIEQAEREELDMLCFPRQWVNERYDSISVPWHIPLDFSNEVMSGEDFLAKKFHYTTGVWQWIFRRSILNDVLFYDGEFWEDAEWTPRIILKARRINTNPQLGYYYMQREESLVSSTTPKSVQKKIKGYYFLLEELLRQKLESPKVVAPWYDGSIAYQTFWFLCMVAHKSPADISATIAFIRKKKLLPLSTYRHSPFIAKKLRLINFSPRLYCWLVCLRKMLHV